MNKIRTLRSFTKIKNEIDTVIDRHIFSGWKITPFIDNKYYVCMVPWQYDKDDPYNKINKKTHPDYWRAVNGKETA